jgi:hypothetical protein
VLRTPAVEMALDHVLRRDGHGVVEIHADHLLRHPPGDLLLGKRKQGRFRTSSGLAPTDADQIRSGDHTHDAVVSVDHCEARDG